MTDTLRVLLVEDNPGDERLIRDLIADITNVSIRVTSCRSLDSAKGFLSTTAYDAVLLDLSLPDSFGPQTVTAIVEHFEVPVIVLTGTNDRELARNAIHAGAQDYLSKKGISAELLDHSLGHAIERYRTRQVTRQSEQRFRAIFEASPLAITIALPEGKGLIAANQAFFEMTGYRKEDLPSLSIVELTVPEDLEAERAGIHLVSSGRQPTFVREKRLVRKDGTAIWVRVAGTVLQDVAGVPQQILVLHQDISTEKEARHRLAESEQRYRAIVESSPVGILTLNMRGTITSCNAAFLRMTDAAETKIVGQHFTKLSMARAQDMRRYLRMFRALARGRAPEPFEAGWKTRDGQERFGEVQVAVMESEEGNRSFQVLVSDITDRRRTQRALRESEAEYHSLFENSALGIYRTTPDGRILAANPALLRMLGLESVEELAAVNLEEEGYPMATPRSVFKERIERDGALHGVESVWTREDGSQIHVREHAHAVRDAEGRILCYEGTLEDITERKELEASLELTQFSMDSTHVMILWLDSEGHIVFVNRSACEQLGYALDELLDRSAWDIELDYPKELRAEKWTELKNSQSATSQGIFTRKSGETFPVEIDARYLAFRGEEYEFVMATDITERRAAARALRESEENYRTIFDAASDVILLHDSETGQVLDCNQKVEEMYGYSVKEFRKLTVEEFSAEEPLYVQERALALIHEAAAGRPQLFEWRCKRQSGELFWTEVSLRQAMLLGRSVVLAIVRDISERKELEAQLRQGQKLESIGTLASGVAHEINNPLMGMINYAELIGSRVEDESLKEFAEGIQTEGARVARIVRNLLSFARQDQEQHSPARIRDIVDASLSLIGSLLRKDFILLDVDVPEDLPLVRCRSHQIQQVLINLATNARDSLNVKYSMGDNRKTVRIAASVHSDGNGTWLRTVVEDAGIGIPKHLQERVFDPFFSTKPRHEGTGLGLSISYGIIRDHGGRLRVESEPGRFTRFTIDLPTAEDAS